MSEPLRKSFSNVVTLEEHEYDDIISHFGKRIIPKKEHLFVAGEICKLVVFCEKGIFRKYLVNEKGEEVVVDFAMEDYWVGDLKSLINKVPTNYYFQALEDCEVWTAPAAAWEMIAEKYPAFGKARKEKELRSHDKAVELLAVEKYATAEEKYQVLVKRFPGIALRVASVHLASYLGIQPESLSRLKKKFAGQ